MTSLESGSRYKVDHDNISSTPPPRPPLPPCYILEDTKYLEESRIAAEDNISIGETELFTASSDSNFQCDMERLQYWLESCNDGHSESSRNKVHCENFLSKIGDFVNQMQSFTEVLTKISNHMIENQRNSETRGDCEKCQLINCPQTASRETSQNNHPPITIKSENKAGMPQDDTQSRNKMSCCPIDSKTTEQFEVIKLENSNKKEKKGMVKKISFSSCRNSNSESSSKYLLKTYANKSSQCNVIMHYKARNTSSESHSNLEINKNTFDFDNKNEKLLNRRKSHKYIESKSNKTVPETLECCSCNRSKYCTECNALRRYPSYENYSQHETPTSWSQHPFVHFSDGYQFFRITRNESNVSQPAPDAFFSVAQGAKQMLGKPLWNAYQ